MPTFALIGAAGYVATRHLQAIQATGNTLVAALDPNDSVGILDSYFPDAAFFTEFERFDRHLEKLRRSGQPVDYITICSPNYLHDAHIRYALRYGARVICEKPLVLNPWNLDALQEMEAETGRSVSTILQLRHHLSVLAAPAIELARNGFIVDETFSQTTSDTYERLLESAFDFLNEGFVWETGSVFKNPELADTIERIVEELKRRLTSTFIGTPGRLGMVGSGCRGCISTIKSR